MQPQRVRGQTSNIVVVFLPDSASTTGAGKTGLTNASAGLNISVRRELSSSMTTYTGANIGAITTLGTWANPGTGKVNIKEVDSTNAPGEYELHFVDLVFGTSDASRFVSGMVTATGIAPVPFIIPLTGVDVQDGVRGGMTALPNAAAGANTGLPVVGTQVPNAVAGAAGGLLIAGTNAPTTINGLTLAGVNASGATPATSGLTLTGGAASTTSGGVAAVAFAVTGGAGAASTNGAASGLTINAGGTTAVSGADAVVFTATGNGNGFTLGHSGTGKDFNATTTSLTLAKTTNITGFNDIAATAIVSGGAITTSAGAVSNVTLTTTTTNLTNLPAVPNNWLTAAGIAASALNGKGDWLLATSAPTNFGALAITAGGIVQADLQTILAHAISDTVAGNSAAAFKKFFDVASSVLTTASVNQTGDAFARLGAPAGASVSADIAAVETHSANIDTQIGTAGAGLTNIGDTRIAHLNQDISTILTTAMAESYAALHAAPTAAQALLLIQQSLHEFAISSTTRTVKKLDGSTTAATFTLDSATTPTSTTRGS